MTTGRFEIFIEDLILWDKYIIFGTGAGASRYLRGKGLDGISPHTEISRLLAEHGIFGLFILVIILSCYLSMKRKNKDNLYKSIQVVLFFIGMGTTMHSAMRTFVTPILLGLSMINIKDKNKEKID